MTDLNSQLEKAKENLKSLKNKQIPTNDQLWNLLEPDLVMKLNIIVEDGIVISFSFYKCLILLIIKILVLTKPGIFFFVVD